VLEVCAALQTENANWSAKLMAHRDWHEQETEALRRQLKQESDEKVRSQSLPVAHFLAKF
jgi:hypothetical protein